MVLGGAGPVVRGRLPVCVSVSRYLRPADLSRHDGAMAQSTGAVARWSLWSEDSFLSIWSKRSILSIGSIGSACSIASIGSFFSIGSIGSAGSALSVLSAPSHRSLHVLQVVESGDGVRSHSTGRGRPRPRPAIRPEGIASVEQHAPGRQACQGPRRRPAGWNALVTGRYASMTPPLQGDPSGRADGRLVGPSAFLRNRSRYEGTLS